MLSAIAARKARFGPPDSQKEHQNVIAEPATTSTTHSGDEQHGVDGKTGTKRKNVVSPAPKPSKRNKSKVDKLQRSTGPTKKRYFEEDITIGHREDVDDDRFNSDPVSRDEEEDVTVNPTTIPMNPSKKSDLPVTPKHVASRHWSPSMPIRDSSDEEEEEGSDAADGKTETKPPPPDVRQNATLSTFQPVLDENTFRLSVDEVSAKHLGLIPSLPAVVEEQEEEGDAITMVVLDPWDTLTLLGTYAFVVVHGCISVAGVTVRASRRDAHRVFAPKSSPIPVMRCLAEGSTLSSSTLSLLPARFDSLRTHKGAVVILQGLRTGIEGLGSICRTFDGMFDPSHRRRSQGGVELLPNVHLITDQTKDIQPFVLPQSWMNELCSVLPPSDHESISVKPVVCLVKGPKKTGKSTFARTLVNQLLSRYRRVAFLECDPGQSEFTPAGMVALNIVERPLFGPPFSHPTIPNSAHYVGATAPRSSPSHYLSAIRELVDFYRLDVQTPVDVLDDHPDSNGDTIADAIPLVVNTMGWNKGLGTDLALRIEEMVEPTDVFDIQSPTMDQGWPISYKIPSHDPGDFPAQSNCRSHVLEPLSPDIQNPNFSPADHRTLSILSYFHSIFPTDTTLGLRQISAMSWNTALPLCAHLPYEIDWMKAVEKVVLIGAGMEDVVPSEIERVLNGALVGLVNCEPGTVDMDTDMKVEEGSGSAYTGSDRKIPYTRGLSAPSPSTSVCYGLALIRALSPTSPHMHIVTPLPAQVFAKGRVFVKGELELPVWGMLDFRNEGGEAKGRRQAGVEMENAPFLRWGKDEGIGTERRRVRRNLMRKGQM